MAKPEKEINKILITSAVAKDKRKTGKAKLNFIDINSEKTRSELYIQRLGMTALKKKTVIEGYKKKRLGKNTWGFFTKRLANGLYQSTNQSACPIAHRLR